MKPRKPQSQGAKGFLKTEGWALAALLLSFVLFFHQWSHPFSRIFLSLDLTVLYDPLYVWVHRHLATGRLPLICDLALHGAPLAALSMAGILSPALWLFHSFSNFPLLFNLIFLAPQALYLFGAYFLGRGLRFSPSAALLLAFLWSYNGHQMAQLDHLNVAWAHAFFPWAFLALRTHLRTGRGFWLLLASLFLGLNLLSGHPQVFFLECLFFLFWGLFSRAYDFRRQTGAVAGMVLGSAWVSSPLILFTAECLRGDSNLAWSAVDRFYHSWTPLNFATLVFPWFFGHVQYDRAGGDYWWRYQFVEMQVAFSVAGLFFILLFFTQKRPDRRWILPATLFALAMALGKFFFVYPLVQTLPFFSFFRDPARYWFLATWALGLGAATAWDDWFKKGFPAGQGRRLALGLAGLGLGILLLGGFFLGPGRPLLEKSAAWLLHFFLGGDSLPGRPLSAYLERLPEKLGALASNLNPLRPRVFLPLLFLSGLTAAVFNRKRWNLSFQKTFLLALVVADLYAFRMPLGGAFYNPADIPAPRTPAPQNRSLTLLYQNVSPLPAQYGEMAYPNMNLVSGRPNLVFDANPTLGRYADLWAKLGWFSWVYKDRDPLGFTRQVDLLRSLGVDQIVSDMPLGLRAPFQTVQNRYPYVYSLPGVYPRAYLGSGGGESFQPPGRLSPAPAVLGWEETRLDLLAQTSRPRYLFLQKTFLPGWKAFVDGKETPTFRCHGVLTCLALPQGKCRVELRFEPTGLRLGFFLFFLFGACFAGFFLRLLLA